MPRKCSVIGCRGNYAARKGEPADVNKVSAFHFPKDVSRKEQWLRRIPQELRSDDITDDMVVCEKHFESRFVIRDMTCYHRPDGSSFTCARDVPVLASDAVPTLFPNTPSYLSTPLPAKRKAPSDRRAEVAARDDKKLKEWLDSDCITGFDDFSTHVSEKSTGVPGEWVAITKSELVLFVLLTNIASSLVPSVVASFKVLRDMRVEWFDDERQRDSSELAWLLGDDIKLSRWSQLPNICAYIQNSCSKESAPTDILSRIQQLLKSLICSLKLRDDVDNKVTVLNFISDQLSLLFAGQKRYSPRYLVVAFRLFCVSRSAYQFLRDTCLTLPHISYLRQLSSCFTHSSTTLTGESAECAYLKQKCSVLAEHERLCVLMIDEIYVSPKVAYKGGNFQGFTMNVGASSDTVEATTVQAFMISSIFSKNKDVVALQPVKNLETSFLHDSLIKVLKMIENIGYKVVCLISDNNRVNRNVFTSICGGVLKPSVAHPLDSSRRLFFMFDSVHLLKSIRNNWINQLDQTLHFPQVVGSTAKACFAYLKQLYDSERSAIVKLAPSLTFTALHPNNTQRQNVKLALKVFDEKNASALVEFGKTFHFDVSGTQNFILTIIQFWKIMNVKHPLKGRNLNDDFCEPIRSLHDGKLHWLSMFYDWLCAWERLQLQPRHGCLSKETMFALKQTVLAAKLLSEYLLREMHCHYVLLGKFQTDDLEFRFGQYRQLSGANYNVSVTQIMESEKKLRILSVVKLVSHSNGDITMRDFIAGCQADADASETEHDCDANLSAFSSVIGECDDVCVSDSEMSALVFVAGYVGFKLKRKLSCVDCRLELFTEKALEWEFPRDESFNYMANVDRGGLTWPTDLLVNIVVQCIVIFKCLVSDKHVKEFNVTKNQRAIMSGLSLQRCVTVLNMSNKCSGCGVTMTDIAKTCIRTVCNISLNNYTKTLTDGHTKSKSLRKLSTLTK